LQRIEVEICYEQRTFSMITANKICKIRSGIFGDTAMNTLYMGEQDNGMIMNGL